MRPRLRVDWSHGPPDIEPSDAPGALFHDGRLVELRTDVRARVASLWLDVPYYAGEGLVPEGVRFGLEVAGVRSVRASISQRPLEPAPTREPGETREAHRARVGAWHALWREVSIDWDEAERVVNADALDLWTGEILESAEGAALELYGSAALRGDDDTPLTLVVAGDAIRWSRSDGVPWSEARMGEICEAYWDAFRARGERLKRSLPYPHVALSLFVRLDLSSADQLRKRRDELLALPRTLADAGIDDATLQTLAPELVYAQDDPRWAGLVRALDDELARRAQ